MADETVKFTLDLDASSFINGAKDAQEATRMLHATARTIEATTKAFKAFSKEDISSQFVSMTNNINRVISSMSNLAKLTTSDINKVVENIGALNVGMNSVTEFAPSTKSMATQLTNLANASEKLSTSNSDLLTFASSLGNLGTALKSLGTVPESINTISSTLSGLDSTQLDTIKSNAEGLAKALEPLTTTVGAVANMLSSLGISGKDASTVLTAMANSTGKLASKQNTAKASSNGMATAFKSIVSIGKNYVGLIGDITKKLASMTKGLISAKNSSGNSTLSVKSLTQALTAAITKVGLLYMGLKKIISLTKSSVDEAANYVEQMNLFTVATQSATGKNTELARSLSETTYGLNSSDFMKYQGSLNMLSVGMGVVNDKSLIMSRNLTQLAYDYSSLFNISPEEVFGKISNAMAGQTKGLKELGNAVTNQMIKQTGLKYGLKGEVSSWDTATQAMMRYETIMRNASKTGVYNDLARSINTPANAIRVFTNQVNIMKRALGGVGLAIGQAVLPYLTALLKVITELANRLAKLLGYDVKDQLKGIDFSGIDYGDAEENIDNIGKSADTTSKKLRKMLLPFDELNVMQEKASSSGSDVGSGLQHLDPSKWDPSNYEWTMPDSSSKVDNIIKNIKDAFKKADWSGIGKDFGKKLNTIIDCADEWITKKFNPFAKKFGKQIATWLNGAIGETNFKKIGQTIAHGLNGITSYLQSFFENFGGYQLGSKLGDLLDGFFDYDFNKAGQMIGSGFNTVFEIMEGFADKLFETSGRWGKKIAGGINNIFETWDPLSAATATVKMANGIIDLFATAVNKLKPDLIRENITTYINKAITGVDVKKFGAAVGTLVHNVMSTLGDVNWEELGFKIGQFLGSINWVEIMTTVGKAIFDAFKGAVSGFFDSAGSDAIWQLPAMLLLTRGKAMFNAIPWDSLISAGAFNGLGNKISTSLSGLGDTLKTGLAGSKVGQAFESAKSFWGTGFSAFGDKAKVSLDTMKTGIAGKLDGIKNLLANTKLGGMIGNMFGKMSSATASVTSGITSIFSKAQGLLAKGITMLGSFLASPAGLIILGVTALALIVGNWDKISKFLKETLPKIIKILGDIIGGITKALASLLGTLLGWLVGSIAKGFASIGKAIADLFTGKVNLAEVGANIVTGLLEGIVNAIAGIGTWIWNNMVKPFVDAFCEALGIHSPSTVFFEYGGYIVQGLINGIKAIIGFVLTPFTAIWEGIKAVFSVAATWFGDVFRAAYQFVVDIFSPIGTFFSGAWTSITTALSSVATWFGDLFKGAYDKVTGVFSPIGSWFAGKYAAIKSVFSSIGGWFGSTFTAAYNKIKSAFSGVKAFFQGVWNGIKSVFSGVASFFKGVFSAVIKPIKGVFNVVRNAMNFVIRGINKVSIDIPSWVPGFGGQTLGFNIPEIPALATGGVVKNATTALVGEAGPEAVVPLKNDKAGIMQIASKLAEYINGNSNNEALLSISKSIDNLAGNTYKNVTANSGYDTSNNMNDFGNYMINIINLVNKQVELEQRSIDNDTQLANQIIDAIRNGRGAQVIIDGREVFNTVVKENNRQIMRTGNSPLGSR